MPGPSREYPRQSAPLRTRVGPAAEGMDRAGQRRRMRVARPDFRGPVLRPLRNWPAELVARPAGSNLTGCGSSRYQQLDLAMDEFSIGGAGVAVEDSFVGRECVASPPRRTASQRERREGPATVPAGGGRRQRRGSPGRRTGLQRTQPQPRGSPRVLGWGRRTTSPDSAAISPPVGIGGRPSKLQQQPVSPHTLTSSTCRTSHSPTRLKFCEHDLRRSI